MVSYLILWWIMIRWSPAAGLSVQCPSAEYWCTRHLFWTWQRLPQVEPKHEVKVRELKTLSSVSEAKAFLLSKVLCARTSSPHRWIISPPMQHRWGRSQRESSFIGDQPQRDELVTPPTYQPKNGQSFCPRRLQQSNAEEDGRWGCKPRITPTEKKQLSEPPKTFF